MAFPIIPILAIAGIVGGVATLRWYSRLSREEQDRADRLALQWFGRRFQDLSEAQQARIRQEIS